MGNHCSCCPWKASANTTLHLKGQNRIVRQRLTHIAARFSALELGKFLFAPVDIASVVYFRIVFGAIMLWQMWRYIDGDRIKSYYLNPDFLFTYLGFDWVQPWPGNGLYIHFYALAILAIFILTGFLYRLSATLFFLGFTYIFLLDQARYLNHYYLVCLVSLLMIFIPAHRSLSLDARLRPRLRSEKVPAWTLWLLRIQMGLVYFFGGVAKINLDWLTGWPLRIWLPERSDVPLIGPLFEEAWTALFFSYNGLFLDLLAAPLLIWKPSRKFAFIALLAFHLLNVRLFNIGIFPWFSMAMTLLFFPPDWPRRIFNWPRSESAPEPAARLQLGATHKVTVALLSIYLAIQVLLPLRHWLYPGKVSWTEEGHRFSWHMKLRDKDADSTFILRDPTTGQTWVVEPEDYLTARQYRKMSSRPYLAQAFAHHLAAQARQEGHRQIEVRTQVWASLNGRDSQRLIDPDTDLAAQPRTLFAPTPWILPLVEVLK
jgi:vitamin K-dependent gamma-carboxylase